MNSTAAAKRIERLSVKSVLGSIECPLPVGRNIHQSHGSGNAACLCLFVCRRKMIMSFAQSRNVLLTPSGWGGDRRTTTDDASRTGPLGGPTRVTFEGFGVSSLTITQKQASALGR